MADDAGQAPNDIIGFLDYYFVKKAPFQIPAAGREVLVKAGPWIAIVLLIATLPVVLHYTGLRSDWWYGPWRYAEWYYLHGSRVAAVGYIAQFVLIALAVPGLFNRTMSAWSLMLYAQIAGALTAILTGLVVSGLIGALIGFYLLAQVRTLYK